MSGHLRFLSGRDYLCSNNSSKIYWNSALQSFIYNIDSNEFYIKIFLSYIFILQIKWGHVMYFTYIHAINITKSRRNNTRYLYPLQSMFLKVWSSKVIFLEKEGACKWFWISSHLYLFFHVILTMQHIESWVIILPQISIKLYGKEGVLEGTKARKFEVACLK